MTVWDRFVNWWNDKISDNFHSETRDSSEFMGRFLNGIDNVWNRITGSGLTGAELEANRFSSMEAEKAFDREVEFYEKYSSPKAQINSQLEAGVNPFSLAGTSAGPVASSSNPSSVAPAGGIDILGLMQTLMNFSLHKKEVEGVLSLQKSQEAKNYAEAENVTQHTSWISSINSMNLKEMQSRIDLNKQKVDESLQTVAESVSRVSVNNRTIELYGSQIELQGSLELLNKTKAVCYQLDAQKASKLMPFIEKRQQAEIALLEAQTEEAKFNAERLMYDANVSMLKVMVEADLISKGYYDMMIQRNEWEIKGSKRDYKWKPINDICSNLSKIAVGVGSVVSGVAGALPAAAAAAAPAAASASLTFF